MTRLLIFLSVFSTCCLKASQFPFNQSDLSKAAFRQFPSARGDVAGEPINPTSHRTGNRLTVESPALHSSQAHKTAQKNFLTKLAHIESKNDPTAIGDNGKALGKFQFTARAWQDVNAIRQKQGLPIWPHEAAHDSEIATEYCQQYLLILSKQLRGALRRNPNPAELVAAYQLGFSGFKKRAFNVPKSIERKLK